MFGDTPLWMVEDAATLERVAERLSKASSIGIDTESDSFYAYRERVCLLQISDLETDYIIDPLAVPDLSPLAPIMASRDVVKVFHGADYDVVCMKRDFGFEIRGIFDTMISAQLLAMRRVGLADLIGEFFGHEIDKKYQRYDWSLRPLLPEHIEYARGDSHFLPALREILARRLQRSGRLAHLEEECLLLENREWAGRAFDPDGYLDIKGASELDDAGKRVLRRLYLHRDEQARSMNRPTFKVIADGDLLRVAQLKPANRDALDRAMPGKSAMKRRHAAALVEAVRGGLDDDFPIPERKREAPVREGPPTRLRGRSSERAFEALKSWRNDLCNGDPPLNPVAVVPNATLKEIARVRPTDLDELRALPDLRNWQAERYGAAMLAVLDDVAPWPPTDDDDDAGGQRRRRRRRR